MTVRNLKDRDRKPWSAMSWTIWSMDCGSVCPIEVIADFLKRDLDEVRQKGLELGMLPKRRQLAEVAFGLAWTRVQTH